MSQPDPFVVVVCPVWDSVEPQFLIEWSRIFTSMHEMIVYGEWDARASGLVTWGSLLPHARNRGTDQVLKAYPDLTHILFLDCDVIGLRAHHIRNMIARDKPIVAATVMVGQPPYRPACCAMGGFDDIYAEMEKPEPEIIKKDWVGTGCVLIKKEVFDALETTMELENGDVKRVWWQLNNSLRAGWKRDLDDMIQSSVAKIEELSQSGAPRGDYAPILLDLFSLGVNIREGGEPQGEDVEFCQRAKYAGFDSYIDCSVQLGHLTNRGIGLEDHCNAAGVDFTSARNDNKSISICGDSSDDSDSGILDGDIGAVGAGEESVPVDG